MLNYEGMDCKVFQEQLSIPVTWMSLNLDWKWKLDFLIILQTLRNVGLEHGQDYKENKNSFTEKSPKSI